MLKALTVSGALVMGIVEGATAQSLTPEQLQAMIDQRVNQQNPYQTLLADPDPERSLAAMQIMLESGDKNLIRLALQFGLLSPNPQVRKTAVEAYIATGPVLTLRLDGANVKDNRYLDMVRAHLGGVVDPDRIGFARLDVGELSEDGSCYLQAEKRNCLFTVNSDGVFLSAIGEVRSSTIVVNARLIVNDSGQLEGAASLFGLDEAVPVTIQLLE
jgi:hypothetical protein